MGDRRVLADPVAATVDDPERERSVGALTRVRDAMMAFPGVLLAIAVFMPISSARLSSSGPPELPRFSAASI